MKARNVIWYQLNHSRLTLRVHCYPGWPRKNATLTINNFKKTRDRMKTCALWHIKFFSQQDDTKIVNFDEGVLIILPFFWGNDIFKICPSFSIKSQFTYQNFSIVWLPRVKCLLLLCKAKPAWIKRSIHYVTLQHYNPGELLKEIPSYFERDFWHKMSKLIETDIASAKWLWNQNAFIKIIIFEISDRKCCILSWPPCQIVYTFLGICHR